MLPSLPPEIIDLIVGHLYYKRTTLKACCLVSKSWVPRARRHLFARVDFWLPQSIRSWVKAFPDPSNSPAHHTRTLRIDASVIIPMANSNTRPLVRSFHLVTALSVRGWRRKGGSSEVVHLICSFPLLKDLWLQFSVMDSNIGANVWDAPSISPKLNGSLVLKGDAVCPIIPRLLNLPGGLHFARITVSCSIKYAESIPDLVSRCSDTLESLQIRYYRIRVFSSAPVTNSHSHRQHRFRHTCETNRA